MLLIPKAGGHKIRPPINKSFLSPDRQFYWEYFQVFPGIWRAGGETGAPGVLHEPGVSTHGGEDGAAGVSPEPGAGGGEIQAQQEEC